MVDETRAPGAPQVGGGEPGNKARILDRYLALVVVAIERPSLYLATVQLPAVQQLMKGVAIVIALGADGSKRRFQRVGGEQRRTHGVSPTIKGAYLLRGAPLPCRAGRPARAL